MPIRSLLIACCLARVAADEVGRKSFHVLPNLAHLTAVKHVFPSVKGDCAVDIRTRGKTFDLERTSPQDSVATIGIPKSIGRITRVAANGRTVWDRGRFSDGALGITEADEDDLHLEFRIPPGEWRFSATAL